MVPPPNQVLSTQNHHLHDLPLIPHFTVSSSLVRCADESTREPVWEFAGGVAVAHRGYFGESRVGHDAQLQGMHPPRLPLPTNQAHEGDVRDWPSGPVQQPSDGVQAGSPDGLRDHGAVGGVISDRQGVSGHSIRA
jgi:hypothetical protein